VKARRAAVDAFADRRCNRLARALAIILALALGMAWLCVGVIWTPLNEE